MFNYQIEIIMIMIVIFHRWIKYTTTDSCACVGELLHAGNSMASRDRCGHLGWNCCKLNIPLFVCIIII